MSGDYTRFTFDPVKGFSGLLKQQGRVSLDADFNEFEEILDRRSRAEMFDVVGQTVVPETTPHGFEISFTGPGKLAIGRGRAYVDGILASTACTARTRRGSTTTSSPSTTRHRLRTRRPPAARTRSTSSTWTSGSAR
jgi:Family of unknown function (DUF6519)